MKKIIIFLFLNLLFVGLHAQNLPNINITSVVLTDTTGNPINQLQLNQPFQYKVNYFLSGNPGSVYTNYIDLIINPLTTNLIDTLLADSTFTYIPSFDSTTIIYNDIATAARYGGGGGAVVVVIWPIYRNTSVSSQMDKDSLKANITASIINPIDWNPSIVFFPNPVNESLFFAYTDKTFKIEHVRLSNIWGQEILNIKGQPDIISTENLENGLYLLEFWDNQNRHIAYKICKK
jgi:hypothetical protein